MKGGFDVLEGVWSHLTDLIASQVDINKGGHVDECLLSDVPDFVAFQAKDVKNTESGESFGWDLEILE